MSQTSASKDRLDALEKNFRFTRADVTQVILSSRAARREISDLEQEIRSLKRIVCVLLDQTRELRHAVFYKNSEMPQVKARPIAETRGNCRIIHFTNA